MLRDVNEDVLPDVLADVNQPEKAGFWEGVPISAGELLKNSKRVLDALRTGPQELASPQLMDEKIQSRKDFENWIDSYTNPKKKQLGFAGMLGGVPIGLLGGLVNLPGSALDTGEKFIDQGESLPRAMGAAATDAVLGYAGLRVPFLGPLQSKGKVFGGLTGGAANLGQDVVSRLAVQGIAEKPETKKMFANTPETMAIAAITGGGMGALAVPRKGTRVDQAKTAEVAANLKAKQEAAPTPDTPEVTYLDALRKNKMVLPPEKADAFGRMVEELAPERIDNTSPALDQVQRTLLHSTPEAQRAQADIEARQQQMEFEMRQRVGLEQGARLRQEQENAPTGYAEWLAAKQQQEAIEQAHSQRQDSAPGEAMTPSQLKAWSDFQTTWREKLAAYESARRTEDARALAKQVVEMLNEPTLQQKVLDILNETPNSKLAQDVLTILRTGDISPPSKTMRSPGGRQRGAVDFNGILDSVSNTAAKIRNKFKHSPDKSPEGHLIKLTGLDIITPGKSAEEIIARQRAAGFSTGHKFIGNLQSGLDALAETYRNIPLLQDVSQHLRAATSKVAKVEREVRQPIEKALVGSSVESKKRMHMVAQTEMHQQRWFTADEMTELGLNPKEIRILEAFHQAHDMGWQAKADSSLSNLGSAPRHQSGYWTSEFSTGPFKVVASWKDADGKTHTYRTSENTKHRQNLAMDWIKKEYGSNPDFQITSKQLRSNYDRMWSHDRTAASLKELLKMYGEPEHGMKKQAIEAILADMDRAMVEGWSGHDLHMDQKKTFARGYAGDRPWRTAEKNAVDFFEAQLNMLTESTRWAAYQEMNGQLKKVFADPDIQSMGKVTDVAHQYVLQELGLNPSFWKNWEASMMDLITPMTGGYFSGPQLKEALQSIKSLAYLHTLGANFTYMMATPPQALNMAIPFWRRLKATGEVSSTNFSRFAKNIEDGVLTGAAMSSKTARNMLYGDKSNQAMWDWAVENNRIPRELIDDYKNIASNPTVDYAVNKLNWTIGRPDQIVRAGVFFAFAKELEASGKFDSPEAAWERAAAITSQVAMPLTKQDRPLIVDKAGTVGNMAWFFMTPVISSWNSYSTFARAPFEKNLNAKQRAQHALALVLFGALVGMSGGLREAPVVGELATVYDFALEHVAEKYPEYYDFLREYDPAKIMSLFPEMQFLNDYVNYGQWSAMSRALIPEGIDMSRKFGMQAIDFNKSVAEHLTGPIGTAARVIGQPIAGAAGSFSSGTSHELEGGIRKALPNLLAGQLETRSDTFLSNTQPVQDMYPGYKNYRNPNNVAENDIYITRSPREQKLKSVGFTSLENRKQLDIKKHSSKTERLDNMALSKLREKAANALMNNSDLYEMKLMEAIKFAPDRLRETEQSLMRKITESTMTAKQKELWKTRTLRAVQRYQERLEAENAGKP